MPAAVPTLAEPQGAPEVGLATKPAPAGAPQRYTPAPTPYEATSQSRHWRYSVAQLRDLRAELNARSKEVTAANVAAEQTDAQEAQASLGQTSGSPPPAQTYLSVDDELLLVRFYCAQAAKISRSFGLPEAAEATAVSYIKRFYLKNSVMEWHPKNIMPTCLFLAAKTTNSPIPIDVFVSKLSKVTPAAVLDLEFLVAQSLAFEFWVRGADKALRGWALELQTDPPADVALIQRTLARALDALARARATDAEFLFSPSVLGLACWRDARPALVDGFLDWKYASGGEAEGGGAAVKGENGTGENGTGENSEGADGRAVDGGGAHAQGSAPDAASAPASAAPPYPYGLARAELDGKLDAACALIAAAQPDVDVAVVKAVDRRLRACANPAKVPGTALYIKRKAEQEAAAAEARAAKVAKEAVKMQEASEVFGGLLPGKKATIGEDAGSGDLGAER